MRLALAPSIALACFSSAALAQANREHNPRETNTAEARLAIESYGKCAAEREPREANRLLTMDFNSSSFNTGLHLLSDDVRSACARRSVGRGQGMLSSDLLFAAAMAEALLEADPTPLNARLARSAAAETTNYSPTDAVAQCLARSLPDQVAALFATAPGSEAEAKAAAPLSQAIAPCARAAGIEASIELTVPAVRAVIATAAYRIVTNAGDANA